jgi:tRNA A37 methylthiotransferase MiaB
MTFACCCERHTIRCCRASCICITSTQHCYCWGRSLMIYALHRLQVRKNRHIEIIPLSTGCLGACTYCKTKHARGVLGSYALDAIVARARQAVADPEVSRMR